MAVCGCPNATLARNFSVHPTTITVLWLAALLQGPFPQPRQDNSAAIAKISTELRPDSTTTAENFRRYLDSLDNIDLNSIRNGLEQYNTLIYSENSALADTLADLFMTFFFATIAFHNDRMWENLSFVQQLHADDGRNDPALAPFYAALETNGLQLYSYGRIYYVDQQPEFLLHAFGPSLSAAFQNFLALRADEIRVGFSDHDSLVISFEEVAARTMKWERHLVNYPRAMIYPRAHFYYVTYLSTLLTGLSQSPTFGDDGMLQLELIRFYDDMAKRHSDTLSGQIVKAFFESLVGAGFRWSPQVREFYELHGIRNMHKAQVPLR